MMIWTAEGWRRIVVMRLDPGEDFLNALRAGLAHYDVRDGVVLSCVATWAPCRLHQVQDTGYPAKERILELPGPVEVMNVSGAVAGGEPHLHATVADREGRAYGGHVEPGTAVLYLAEVVVGELSGNRMVRVRDARGIAQLTADNAVRLSVPGESS
jgi:predicted DNA-binding protein with PD1-like motif